MSVTDTEILGYIAEALHEVRPDLAGHELAPADSLADLGADSMDRADIVVTVLDRMGLDVPLIETAGTNTAGELAERLHGLAESRAS